MCTCRDKPFFDPLDFPARTAFSISSPCCSYNAVPQSQHFSGDITLRIHSKILANLARLGKHRDICTSHDRVPRKVRECYRKSTKICPHSRIQRPRTTSRLGRLPIIWPETAHLMSAVENGRSKCPLFEVVQEGFCCDKP